MQKVVSVMINVRGQADCEAFVFTMFFIGQTVLADYLTRFTVCTILVFHSSSEAGSTLVSG